MNPLVAQSSIAQLEHAVAVGQRFSDKEGVQRAVLALLARRGEADLAAKLKTEAGRVYVGCMRKGCAFVVRAKPNEEGQWIVTHSGTAHSCDDDGGRRKRQLSSSTLQALAPDVQAVAVVRGSAAAAVQNLVATSTGVQIKRTQAASMAKANRSDPIATALNEYQFVGSFIAKLHNGDETGTYLFQSVDSPDGATFSYTYVAPTASKKFWEGNERHVIAVDTTYLTGPLGGCFFAAVTKDAANELVLLASGHMQKENRENWFVFLQALKKDFPNIRVIICDKQKGLEACKNDYPAVRFARCAKHLLENVKQNDLGPVTDDFAKAFWGMAKAPTEASYKDAFQRAKAANRKAAEWVHERKDEFAEYVFLGEGKKRYGDTTSNMAEQYFSTFTSQDWKSLPIIQLTQNVLVRESKRAYTALNTIERLGQPSHNLTPWMEKELRDALWKANKVELQVQLVSPYEFVGCYNVKNTAPIRSLQVKLKLFQANGKPAASAECDCGLFKSLGRPCKHALAALRVAHSRYDTWNFCDSVWVSSVFHFSTWRKEHVGQHFPKTAVIFSEADRVDLLPPPMPKRKGKKSKDKKQRKAPNPDKKRRVFCPGCGEEGHLLKTCTSTQAIKIAQRYKSKELPVMPNFEDDVVDGGLVAGDEETARAFMLSASAPTTKDEEEADLVRAIRLSLAGTGKKARRIIIDLADE
jgi:hypothetical protein